VSQALLARPEQASMCSRAEELRPQPDDLGSPWRAASASFVAFARAPHCFSSSLPRSLRAARHRTVARGHAPALFVGRLGLSLFTPGRNALRGALRMVLIGGGAGRGELPRRAALGGR